MACISNFLLYLNMLVLADVSGMLFFVFMNPVYLIFINMIKYFLYEFSVNLSRYSYYINQELILKRIYLIVVNIIGSLS